MTFGTKDFYLVIEFQFGHYFLVLNSNYVCILVVVLSDMVRLEYVRNVFDKSFDELLDKDMVRVCLLYSLEKGFNGQLLR